MIEYAHYSRNQPCRAALAPDGSGARFAHIGGFIAGLVLIIFMHDRVSHPLMGGHRRRGSWG